MIALLLLGCVTGPGANEALPRPDPDVFAMEVQPILAVSCANPSCHGQPGRPLSIYAPERYRMDPADTFLDTPLTDEELAANFASASAFLVGIDDPIDCELVGKPLAVECGGMEHAGGTQFQDLSEPDFLVVEDWVAAALEEGR